MNEWIAILYGIIQGVTEFAPVSSSGHLALLPHLIHFKDPGVVFDLGMHMGTLLAVVLYFRGQIGQVLKGIFQRQKGNFFFYNMLIATIATIISVLLIKGMATQFGRAPLLIVINLLLFGLLMFLADHFCSQQEQISMDKHLYLKKSLLIGVAQALAIFPGVSRSGATLTISRAMNLTRVEASRFSFLLSVPIILLGFLHKLPDFFGEGVAFDFGSCFLGALVSFGVGIATIHFFMRFIAKIGLKYFAIYRVILAFVIFWVLFY